MAFGLSYQAFSQPVPPLPMVRFSTSKADKFLQTTHITDKMKHLKVFTLGIRETPGSSQAPSLVVASTTTCHPPEYPFKDRLLLPENRIIVMTRHAHAPFPGAADVAGIKQTRPVPMTRGSFLHRHREQKNGILCFLI